MKNVQSYKPHCKKAGPGFPTKVDIIRNVQPKRVARGLKLQI